MKSPLAKLVLLVCLSGITSFSMASTSDEFMIGEWNGGDVDQDADRAYKVRLYIWMQNGTPQASYDLPNRSDAFDLPFSEVILENNRIKLTRQTSSDDRLTLEGEVRNDVMVGEFVRNGKRAGIFQLIKNPSRITKNATIPDFEVTLIDNETKLSQADLVGGYYLIDFWATWCPPCVEEMPNLLQAYEEFSNRDFTIVSVSVDQNPEVVEKFRRKVEMPWTNAHLPQGLESEVAKNLNVRGVPTAYLVSPDGRILASGSELTGESLHTTLTRYLDDK